MTLRANYHKEEEETTVIEQIKSFKVTIGYPGASGCDYLFTSAANTTEQSIELVNLFPRLNISMSIMLICIENCDLTVTWDYGTSAGGADLGAGGFNDDLNDIYNTAIAVGASITAKSIFLNATPGANWDTMTSGKWTFYFVYFDYTEVEEIN